MIKIILSRNPEVRSFQRRRIFFCISHEAAILTAVSSCSRILCANDNGGRIDVYHASTSNDSIRRHRDNRRRRRSRRWVVVVAVVASLLFVVVVVAVTAKSIAATVLQIIHTVHLISTVIKTIQSLIHSAIDDLVRRKIENTNYTVREMKYGNRCASAAFVWSEWSLCVRRQTSTG